MRVLDQIYRDYLDIDSDYALEEDYARLRSFNNKVRIFQAKRLHNDQSTFLYLFTRFEGRVNQYCRQLISLKKARTRSWKSLRSWDVLDHQNVDRIIFMHRIALLTDMRGADYTVVRKYYQARNDIAHGNLARNPVAIPVVYRDIRRLYSDLRP